MFSLVAIGSGMSTSDAFAVLSMVSIFLGRQTAKYFDIQELLSDQYKKYDSVTWVQNGLSCVLFLTAFVVEYQEGTATDLVDYLIGIAALVQLILLISKRFSDEPNQRRMVFEETVGSLYHFVVLGSLLSRVSATSKDSMLISIASVVIADFSARTQVLDTTDFADDTSPLKVPSSATKLLISRVASFALSATAAVCGILLFDDAQDSSLATLAMVGGVLKALNSIAFLLDSRTQSYKSVYNFVSNGSTSLLLLTSAILLGNERAAPETLTVVLFTAALASRITDMVQNAYASPDEEDTKMYKSSIDDPIEIDSAGIYNFRAVIVFILLVTSSVVAFVGGADKCPEFLSASNATDVSGVDCGSQEDVNILLSYFSMITGHAILGVVAFVVAATQLNRYIALSTVEIPRVLVSTAIISLGGLVLGSLENTALSLSFILYALADGLGMSLM